MTIWMQIPGKQVIVNVSQWYEQTWSDWMHHYTVSGLWDTDMLIWAVSKYKPQGAEFLVTYWGHSLWNVTALWRDYDVFDFNKMQPQYWDAAYDAA